MPSFRRWMGFVALGAFFLVSGQAPAEVYPPGAFRPGPFGPRPPIVAPPGPMIPLPPPQALLLVTQAMIHAQNITSEITAMNEFSLAQGKPFIIHPVVLSNMLFRSPYLNQLIRTTLTAVPPLPPQIPFWRPRPVEYMVGWRMNQVFVALNRLGTALQALPGAAAIGGPAALATQAAVFNQMRYFVVSYSIAIPAMYFYIEALRETYLINPLNAANPLLPWPNDELKDLLIRMEAQVFVLRSLMENIFCHAFFRPLFPVSWGFVEATFFQYRLNVAAPGPVGIPPFPFFMPGAQGGAFYRPNIAPVPRPAGGGPLLAYDPALWNGSWEASDPAYVERFPVNPGAAANVPGLATPQPVNPNLGGAAAAGASGAPVNGAGGPGGFNPGLAANGAGPGGFNPGMSNGGGPGGFNPGMSNGGGPGGFNPGMSNGGGPGGFNPGMGAGGPGGPGAFNPMVGTPGLNPQNPGQGIPVTVPNQGGVAQQPQGVGTGERIVEPTRPAINGNTPPTAQSPSSTANADDSVPNNANGVYWGTFEFPNPQQQGGQPQQGATDPGVQQPQQGQSQPTQGQPEQPPPPPPVRQAPGGYGNIPQPGQPGFIGPMPLQQPGQGGFIGGPQQPFGYPPR